MLQNKNLLMYRKDGSIDNAGTGSFVNTEQSIVRNSEAVDKTSYKGNDAENKISGDNSFKFTGSVPRISFTPVEFLEAYGLEKRLTNRGYMEYNSNERKLAFDALHSLSIATL